MKLILLGLTAIVLSSCASLRGGEGRRQLVLEREWARDTVEGEFYQYRRAHRMQPVFFGPMVIQGNAIDGIIAYRRDSGAEVWRLRIENGVEGGALLHQGRLYFGASDGVFYCLSAEDGRVVWTFPVRAETLSQPSLEGGIVYFQSGADMVFALDANTGKQLWLYNRQVTNSLSIRASTQPIVDGAIVYAGFADGFIVALSKQSGALQWEKKLAKSRRFNDVDATPVIDGSLMYVSSYDGALFALNKTTGDVQWEYNEGGYNAVTLGKDALYYATTSGLVVALDKASGRVIWSRPVKGIATRPVLLDGYLVYGESTGNLIVANANTGSPMTDFAPGRGLLGQPAVDEKTDEIYFISNSANLYAMKLKFVPRAAQLPWQPMIF